MHEASGCNGGEVADAGVGAVGDGGEGAEAGGVPHLLRDPRRPEDLCLHQRPSHLLRVQGEGREASA